MHAAARPALRGGVEAALNALGFDVRVADERGAPLLRLGRHVLGAAARARQRAARPQARPTSTSSAPPTIVSANIGCIQHLQSGTSDAGAALGRGRSTTRSRTDREPAMTPRYEEHDPDPALAAHVHCIWRFEGDEDGAEQAVPPDGRCELIAHGGRPYDERGADGAWHAQAPLLFAGQLTRPLVLRSRGPVAVIGVRFKPAGAWAFVGAPMAVVHRPSPRPRRRCTATARPRRCARSCATRRRRRADRRAEPLRRGADRLARPPPRRRDRGLRRAHPGERRPRPARRARRRSPASASASCSAASPRSSASRRACSASSSGCAGSSTRCATRRGRPGPSAPRPAGFFDHPQMARDFRRLLGTAPTRWAARRPGLATSLADSAA